LFANAAQQIPRPADTLFVDESVYTWQALDELAVSGYWIGRYQESADACRQLLGDGHLPPDEISRVEKNLAFAEERLSESRSSAKPE
jgi:hypothetical protein